MNTKPKKKKTKLIEWRDALVFAVVVATLFRWSLAEAFVIPTGSMENSILVGDYILVSKVTYGTRTPQTPLQLPLTHQKIWGTELPSYFDWFQIPAYRLPGLREVKRGETVVFNAPKDLLEPTERPMDLMTYLVKRCVAVPGDKLMIRNRQVFINEEPVDNPEGIKFQYQVVTEYPLQSHHLASIGLDEDDYWFSGYSREQKSEYGMLLTEAQLEDLQKAPYLLSIEIGSGSTVGFSLFPAMMHDTWDLHNYGPVTVPQKGMDFQVNAMTLDLYGELIKKYESNKNVILDDDKLVIDGETLDHYTFKQDYFFMMGDSRDNSIDSRYWGFVPESHLVGKPVMVLFSKDEHGAGLNKVRWSRIFSRID